MSFFFLDISPSLDFFLTFPFPIDSISVFQISLVCPPVWGVILVRVVIRKKRDLAQMGTLKDEIF